jgi:hypothetical protein
MKRLALLFLVLSSAQPAWAHVYDIRQYGARCDARTDDTLALQRAIAAAQQAGGGIVQVPIGTCLVKGVLRITRGNVGIKGEGRGSRLLFANGSRDGIDIGGQPSQIYGDAISDIYLDASGKTGGVTVSMKNVAEGRLTDVVIDHAWAGFYAQQTNSIDLDGVLIVASQKGAPFGIKWYSPANNARRSDVLVLRNVTVQMDHSGGDCLVWDGMTQTLRGFGVALLGCAYGLHVENTAHSKSYYPAFGMFNDLETDGITREAVRIEGGNYFYFTGCELANDNPKGSNVMQVLPDSTGSITRGIFITGSSLHDANDSAAIIDARDVHITGSALFDVSKAGNGAAPAVVIGSRADRVSIVASALGYGFGQGFRPSYGVVIARGANHVLLADDDFFWATRAAIRNLTAGVVEIRGGFDRNGNPIASFPRPATDSRFRKWWISPGFRGVIPDPDEDDPYNWKSSSPAMTALIGLRVLFIGIWYKLAREPPVNALVEENPHVTDATSRSFAASRKAMTCSRVTVGKPARNSSIESPASGSRAASARELWSRKTRACRP